MHEPNSRTLVSEVPDAGRSGRFDHDADGPSGVRSTSHDRTSLHSRVGQGMLLGLTVTLPFAMAILFGIGASNSQ